MRLNKLETARTIAKAHFRVEPRLHSVFVLLPLHEEDGKDPIKLLEVVEDTIECGFEPVGFAPDPTSGIHYPSWVIEVSPREYESVRSSGTVRLGDDDWTIGEEVMRA